MDINKNGVNLTREIHEGTLKLKAELFTDSEAYHNIEKIASQLYISVDEALNLAISGFCSQLQEKREPHTIEVVLYRDHDTYKKIKAIASKHGISFDEVLTMLVLKDLNKHLENNLKWAETLSEELLSAYKSATKNPSANNNEVSFEEFCKLFDEIVEDIALTAPEEKEETKIVYDESDFCVPSPYCEKLVLRHNLDEYAESRSNEAEKPD